MIRIEAEMFEHDGEDLPWWEVADPIEPGTFRGRVTINGAPATSFYTSSGIASRRFEHPRGEFEIAGLGGLEIVADGAEGTRIVRSVRSGESLDLGDIELRPAPIITGVVLAADGLPVPGADVTLSGHVPGFRRDITDRDGRFALQSYGGAQRVFVSSPRGRGEAQIESTHTIISIAGDPFPAE